MVEALESAETWKGIGPIDEVWDAHHENGRLQGFSWSARAAGRTWNGTAHRLDTDAESLALGLEASEVGGRITVAVTPTTDGTEIGVRLDAHSRGMLAGMFWGVIADALRTGLPGQVEAFARSLSGPD